MTQIELLQVLKDPGGVFTIRDIYNAVVCANEAYNDEMGYRGASAEESNIRAFEEYLKSVGIIHRKVDGTMELYRDY